MGLSIVIATVLRFSTVNSQIQVIVSTDGLRSSAGIVVLWAVAGLRLAFLSPGNQQGSWILHLVHGRPPEIGTALKQLSAVKIWALLFVAILTGSAFLAACAIAPPDFLTWRAVTAQILVAAGFCLLLTDLFFLHVTTVAKYFTFFPIVVWLSLVSGPWIEHSVWHYIAIPVGLVVAHWLIELRHREIVRLHCLLFDPEDRENSFLLRLDLRDDCKFAMSSIAGDYAQSSAPLLHFL